MKHKYFFSKTLSAILLSFSLLLTPTIAFADNTYSENNSTTVAEYDLVLGGIQSFTIKSSNYETLFVTISELPTINKTVSNGTYKVSFTSPGAWTAGYNITISKNCITDVNSPFYSTITGSISLARLTLDNTKQASYNFIYKRNFLNIETGVKSILSGDSIRVSAI